MNITYTKGHKTKETNYAKLNTKREAKSTKKCHKFWCLQWHFQELKSLVHLKIKMCLKVLPKSPNKQMTKQKDSGRGASHLNAQ